MTTTATDMQQAMTAKDEAAVVLTEAEWQRMRDEIDVELNKLCAMTQSKTNSYTYQLRSFVRDAPNKGKLWPDECRETRLETSLQSRGFTVTFNASQRPSSSLCTACYTISWAT